MKTFGKIAGAWGLLLLLPSPLIYFLAALPYALAMGGLGILGVGIYIATHLDRLRDSGGKSNAIGGTARSGFFYSSSALIALVAIAALVGLNFIVSKRAKTYDLTNKKIYSLAPQTITTLKELKEPIHAIGFLPKDHPAYDALDGLLKRYTDETDKFTYEFKDPRKAPDLAAKYQLKEGQTTFVLTKGTGDKEAHTSLNIISEQELTNSLIKINKVGEQAVYFIVGHGEWPLEAPQQAPGSEPSVTAATELKRSLEQEGYAPLELNLAEHPDVPDDASLLIIAGARTKFSESEKTSIDKWLAIGGRLVYFADTVGVPGLDSIWAKYGIGIDKGLLVDPRLNPDQPYVIPSPYYGEHEITHILKAAKMNVEFPQTHGLTILRKDALEKTDPQPIVTTSPFAWEESEPNENPHLDSGEKAGAIPMVIASSRSVTGEKDHKFDETRVVVFGNSLMLVDALWGHEANRNLVMNAIAWASSQVQKITIRPPDRDISTIDLDEKMMEKLRFLSIAVLPLLLTGIGWSIWLTRRNK